MNVIDFADTQYSYIDQQLKTLRSILLIILCYRQSGSSRQKRHEDCDEGSSRLRIQRRERSHSWFADSEDPRDPRGSSAKGREDPLGRTQSINGSGSRKIRRRGTISSVHWKINDREGSVLKIECSLSLCSTL
jgi:hypothetical protein